MAEYLPQELVVKIMERLPVKSLLRFTSVSKRWRSIISNPNFAKSNFQIASLNRTLSHRVVANNVSSFGDSSSVRKVSCPFNDSDNSAQLLCSCNGLVCAQLYPDNQFHIWNPSTGFYCQLPEPVGYPLKHRFLIYFGFGYLSASDDYKLISKLFILSYDYQMTDVTSVRLVFSSKTNTWKKIKSCLDFDLDGDGTLSNEALHWLDDDSDLVAFDLATEGFRIMRPPVVHGGELKHVKGFGDSLCVFDVASVDTAGCIDLWVMKQYGVVDSWTKLFKLKVSNQPEEITFLEPILVSETATFLQKHTGGRDADSVIKLIRSGHTKEEREPVVLSVYADDIDFNHFIEYEETLLWLGTSMWTR